jgi:hypothetical protein
MTGESARGDDAQERPQAPPSGALAEAVGATTGMAVGALGGAWLVTRAWAHGPWVIVPSAALAAVGFFVLMIAGSVCGRMAVECVRAPRRR